MPTCPNCEKDQIEKRKMNIPRNVKLRSIGSTHDPYVCRDCGWTGKKDDLVVSPEDSKYRQAAATEW